MKLAYQKISVFCNVAILVVMSIAVLAPERYLFQLRNMPRLFFASPLIVFVALLIFVINTLILKVDYDVKDVVKNSWPLLVFVAGSLLLLLWSYTHPDSPSIVRWPHPRWWLNYGFALLALGGAYFLGIMTQGVSDRRFGLWLISLFSISLLIGLAELLQLSSYDNPIGSFLLWLNDSTRHLYWVWEWGQQDGPIRAQGLSNGPAWYAFAGATGLVWALAVRKNKLISLSLVIMCLSIIIISGSRSVIFGIFVAIFGFLIVHIQNRKFIDWLVKRKRGILGAVLSVIFLVVTVVSIPAIGESISHRLFSGANLEGSGVESDGRVDENELEIVDQVSSGRISLWASSLTEINKDPFGTGYPFYISVGRSHAHNDILSMYIWAGPIGIGLLFLLWWWILTGGTSRPLPIFGFLFGTLAIATSMLDGIFVHHPVLLLGLFFLGVYTKNEIKKESISLNKIQAK